MLEKLKDFFKEISVYDTKIAHEKAEINELHSIIDPYLEQIRKKHDVIKKIKLKQNELEQTAVRDGLLTFNIRDFIMNFCKLKKCDLTDISLSIKIEKNYDSDSAETLLEEIKQDPSKGVLRILFRTRKDSMHDFIYSMIFDINPNQKFSDGSSIFDNLKTKRGELIVNPDTAHRLILTASPNQVIKQMPWTQMRKDEMFYKAVYMSSVKYWTKQQDKTKQ